MPFVVTGACVGCKHSDCVEVCPADCFHDAGDMLVIDPESCTECNACEAECPEEAIFHDSALEESHWINVNEEKSKVSPSAHS